MALTRTEYKLIRRWPIDIGVALTRTQIDTRMTDRYRCGFKNWNLTQATRKMVDRYRCDPNLKTQIDKTMTNRYRCDPESNSNKQDEWPIYIGVIPKTQTQTNKMMTDWYRCDPKNWKLIQTDRMMTDRYRCGPETQTKLKQTRWWIINMGAVPKLKLNSNRHENDRSI